MSFAPPSIAAPQQHEYFSDDDEETWKILVAQDHGDADVSPLLVGVAARLQEDWGIGKTDQIHVLGDGEKYWKDLVSSLTQKTSFLYSDCASQPADARNSPASEPAKETPAAFQSDTGKKHVSAAASLLGISEHRAVQVTLGALRSMDISTEESETSDFSSLLGTLDLLFKCMAYHYQQRLARLSVLTECLRLEEDPDSCQHNAVVSFLNALDSTFTQSGITGNETKTFHRGLFKSLLIIGCQPDPKPNLAALEPSKDLLFATAPWGSDPFTSFAETIVIENTKQAARERTQAMEGMHSLLYGERMQGGVMRCDYGLFISAAFDSRNTARTLLGPRWKYLVGLICAESMCLWKAIESAAQNAEKLLHEGTTGATNLAVPPMITDLDSAYGLAEMNSLITIWDHLMQHGSSQAAWMQGLDRPESVAALSFGFLLLLAKEVHPSWGELGLGEKSLGSLGVELVRVASDQGGAFDYLATTVTQLTGSALTTKPTSAKPETLYDWQLSDSVNNDGEEMQVMQSYSPTTTAHVLSADVVSYTSIAQEVVGAAIALFRENILATDTSDSCQKIGTMSSLVAFIYKNNAALCDQFWNSWDTYLATRDTELGSRTISKFPICQLFDAAYDLALRALKSIPNNEITVASFVNAASPFLSLFSTLCYTSDIVEKVFNDSISILLQTSLLCCTDFSPTTITASDEVMQSRISILQSFATIVQVGRESKPFVNKLLKILGDANSTPATSAIPAGSRRSVGPGFLAGIVSHGHADHRITCAVLQIIGHLLDSAPTDWVVEVASHFLAQDGSATPTLNSFVVADQKEVSHSAVLVLAGLIGRFDALSFEKLLHPKDAVAYLQGTASCLVAALTSLAALSMLEQPNTMRDELAVERSQTSAFSFATIRSILQACTDFLKWTRPLLSSGQEEVAKGATLVRDSFIRSLACGDICTGIVYYAVGPVSHTVVLKMEDEMRDADILDRVTRAGNVETVEKYGAWAFLSSSKTDVKVNESLVKGKVLGFLSKMSVNDLDFAAMRARGWSCDEDGTGQFAAYASGAALRLLSEWASHVEDIARTHQEDLAFTDSSLSEEAAKIIRDFSPQKSLWSSAPTPMPCWSNGALSSLWQDLSLSTFDLLLPYLSLAELHAETDRDHIWVLASAVLDFLNACVVQSRALITSDSLHDSSLVRSIFASARFVPSLIGIVERAADRTESLDSMASLSEKDRLFISSAFLSLRLLGSCAALNAASPSTIWNESVLELLVNTSSRAQTVLDFRGNGPIFPSGSSVLRMRLATASIDVLASIWHTARLRQSSNSESEYWSSLSKYSKRDSFFVSQLMKVVCDYSQTDDIDGSTTEITANSEHGRISVMLYLTSSLQILMSTFTSSMQIDDDPTHSADTLMRVYNSRSFMFLQSFSLSAQIRRFFGGAVRDAGLGRDPVNTLASFPATSSNILSRDYYRNENSFDQRSLRHWYAAMRTPFRENGRISLEQVIDELSRSHCLVYGELAVMESWATYLKIVSYDVFKRNDFALSGSNVEILMNHARDTLESLKANLRVAAESTSSGYFMSEAIVRMTRCLGRLLLFLLELGAFEMLPPEGLVSSLGLLTDAMEYLHDVICPLSGEGSTPFDELTYHAQTYSSLQQTLLGCCLILVRNIAGQSLENEIRSTQRDVNTKLCLITCRFFQTFSRCGDATKDMRSEDSKTVQLCSKLLTHVVLSDSHIDWTRVVAGMLIEYETLKLLTQYASFLSLLESRNVTNTSEHLSCIKSVFNLLQATAGMDDTDILSTLPCLELSQLVIRNPLFGARFRLWCAQDPRTAPPRGYIFKGEMAMVAGQKASLLVGSNDPVFDIWVSAMKFLGATTRCLNRTQIANEKINDAFSDMSIEFLGIYRDPLLACLKSCGEKLTKNALNEATVLLALVAELCERGVREKFEHPHKGEFNDFLLAAKCVASTLSKFLGATGNSQELFLAIHEHESTDGDGFDQQATSPFTFARDRLLSDGYATVKHEAIKFSHYASGRVGRITKADFEASALVPHYLKQFSVDHSHENDLERNCRLAVTSKFSLELVHDASKCLYQALSLIWRTHSSSYSFFTVSNKLMGGLDLLRLLEPGLVVGYRPNVGECLLEDKASFQSLRFGVVVDANTFERTWVVEVTRLEGSGTAVSGVKEKINPRQLVGVEDKSARIPSANLMTAPDSMASFELLPSSLSIANYILILRWCHQQFVFGQGRAFESGTNCNLPRFEQEIAEKAAVLLAADLVLHSLNGDFKGRSKDETSLLNAQIFELFADKEIIQSNAENDPTSPSIQEGRLKDIISGEIWISIQQQVGPFVQQAWNEKLEADRKQKELKGSRWMGRRSVYRLR